MLELKKRERERDRERERKREREGGRARGGTGYRIYRTKMEDNNGTGVRIN